MHSEGLENFGQGFTADVKFHLTKIAKRRQVRHISCHIQTTDSIFQELPGVFGTGSAFGQMGKEMKDDIPRFEFASQPLGVLQELVQNLFAFVRIVFLGLNQDDNAVLDFDFTLNIRTLITS
jgi:hypothetical protein